MNLNKLFESNDLRMALMESDINNMPEEKMAIQSVLDYNPKELATEVYDHYVETGVITKEGTWDEPKLGDFYRNSPEDLLKLYDIVSENRYSNEVLPTPFIRHER